MYGSERKQILNEIDTKIPHHDSGKRDLIRYVVENLLADDQLLLLRDHLNGRKPDADV